MPYALQAAFTMAIKGWVRTSDAFTNAGLAMGSVEGYVGYALAATLALDVVLLVVAVCATGKTREKCLGGKRSCGRCCVRTTNMLVRLAVWCQDRLPAN